MKKRASKPRDKNRPSVIYQETDGLGQRTRFPR